MQTAGAWPPLIHEAPLPNGVTLPYVEVGDPAGVPLILLHGLIDSWRSFELVLPLLSERVRAIAPSQRGHGDASRPAAGYRIEDFASDVAVFMDVLGLEAAVVAGHSSHALVAERFAIDHPERTLGLVLIGAPVSLRDKPGVQGLLDSVSKLSDPIDPAFAREFVEGTFLEIPGTFLETMVSECLKVPARVWKEAFAALAKTDLSPELAGIEAPALLLWGDQDSIVPRSDQDALTGLITRSNLKVYPGIGHSPHWEAPERFAADASAFVETLGR
jgi:pimeloyl-ACP methyl ester carboxylesterase